MEQEKNWERQALEHLLLENLKETRKARRWKTLLRVLSLLLIVGFLLQVLDVRPFGDSFGTERHTAMVSIEGKLVQMLLPTPWILDPRCRPLLKTKTVWA